MTSRYADTVTDQYARPIPGALVYVYIWDLLSSTAGALEALTTDTATSLSNPLTTDSFGGFYFNAPNGAKLIEVHFGGKLQYREQIQVGPIPSGPPGGPGALFGLFTNLINITAGGATLIASSGYSAIDKGAGVYVYDAAVNSAYVAAHPLSSGLTADGKGFRLSLEQDITPEMCGALGGGVTDDTAAFQAVYDLTPASGTIVVPSGAYNIGSLTGTKQVLWRCLGATNAGGTAPLTLPGIVETHFQTGKRIVQAITTVADFASSSVFRTTSHTGGTSGNTAAGLEVTSTVGAGVTNFEWAIIGKVDNSATAGQNVGIYAQGLKRASGPTWGAVAQVMEPGGAADPLGGSVGLEVDVTANGTDANSNRVGIDIVAGRAVLAGAVNTVSYGLRISAQAHSSANAVFKTGISLNDVMTTGIQFGNTANVTVGIDYSAGTFGSVIRFARQQKIDLEPTGVLQIQSLSASDSILKFTNTSVEKVGLDLATPALRMNGTQVVGVRDTGWAADTGTAKKTANATYAAGTTLTYSATYVQSEQTAMATRVAALEAVIQSNSQTIKALKDALIAHGQIGT